MTVIGRGEGDVMKELLGRRTWSSDVYPSNARFVPLLGTVVMGLLTPRQLDRVLHVGHFKAVLTVRGPKPRGTMVDVDAVSEGLSFLVSLLLPLRRYQNGGWMTDCVRIRGGVHAV